MSLFLNVITIKSLLNYTISHITRMHFDGIRFSFYLWGSTVKSLFPFSFQNIFFWPIFTITIKKSFFRKHVKTCWNMFKHIKTCSKLSFYTIKRKNFLLWKFVLSAIEQQFKITMWIKRNVISSASRSIEYARRVSCVKTVIVIISSNRWRNRVIAQTETSR